MPAVISGDAGILCNSLCGAPILAAASGSCTALPWPQATDRCSHGGHTKFCFRFFAKQNSKFWSSSETQTDVCSAPGGRRRAAKLPETRYKSAHSRTITKTNEKSAPQIGARPNGTAKNYRLFRGQRPREGGAAARNSHHGGAPQRKLPKIPANPEMTAGILPRSAERV